MTDRIPKIVMPFLMAQIAAVRELHSEVNGPYDDTMCKHCFIDEHRYWTYPCPTIKALDDDQLHIY